MVNLFFQILECSDRFIVCGDEYTKLREQLTRAILGQNLDNFEEAIQVRLPYPWGPLIPCRDYYVKKSYNVYVLIVMLTL